MYLVNAGDQAGNLAGNAEALSHYKQAFAVSRAAFGDEWDPAERAVLEVRMGETLFSRGEHELAVEYLQRAGEHVAAAPTHSARDSCGAVSIRATRAPDARDGDCRAGQGAGRAVGQAQLVRPSVTGTVRKTSAPARTGAGRPSTVADQPGPQLSSIRT